MVAQAGFIFVAIFATGVKFNVPRRALVPTAFIAATGWLATEKILAWGLSRPEAFFTGAVVVALSAEVAARVLKTPTLVFSVPAILPLVPGSVAYRAMADTMTGDYDQAVQGAALTLLLTGGVASGLLLAAALSRWLKRRETPSGSA